MNARCISTSWWQRTAAPRRHRPWALDPLAVRRPLVRLGGGLIAAVGAFFLASQLGWIAANRRPALARGGAGAARRRAPAHDLSERHGEFLGALLHPLVSLDHAAAFLALGLLAGRQQPPLARRLLVGFYFALLAGAVAAGGDPGIDRAEPRVRCSRSAP